jgi:hypothetical protein
MLLLPEGRRVGVEPRVFGTLRVAVGEFGRGMAFEVGLWAVKEPVVLGLVVLVVGVVEKVVGALASLVLAALAVVAALELLVEQAHLPQAAVELVLGS